MEAEQVTDKILADAKSEADKIKEQAEERLAAEQAKLEEQLADYREQTQALAAKAARDKKLHLLASARMDIAKELLAEKRKIVDEVFEQAGQQLLNMADGDYRKLCTKLMLDAVETGDEEVIVDKNEKRIDQEFIKNINRELGPGYKGNLKLADEKQDLAAGFVLRRGRIKNNVSVQVLLAQARKQLEIQLAKDLFS
ncbi:MAG: V-type ATP synthase subunit E [Planctomycetota bacterium]|jgi:V/A-type H+-transporting ATPase subunit E